MAHKLQPLPQVVAAFRHREGSHIGNSHWTVDRERGADLLHRLPRRQARLQNMIGASMLKHKDPVRPADIARQGGLVRETQMFPPRLILLAKLARAGGPISSSFAKHYQYTPADQRSSNDTSPSSRAQ
ncbi:hypothetical protein NFJ02_10g02970 [Pycnococcus provasolii]